MENKLKYRLEAQLYFLQQQTFKHQTKQVAPKYLKTKSGKKYLALHLSSSYYFWNLLIVLLRRAGHKVKAECFLPARLTEKLAAQSAVWCSPLGKAGQESS